MLTWTIRSACVLSGVAGRRDLVSSQSDRQQRKVRRARAAVTAQSGHDRRDMSSDIAREESFRTALRNQKRRLSATEKKPVTAEFGPGTRKYLFDERIKCEAGVNKSVLGGLKTRDSLTPPRRDLLTPPRATPPRWVDISHYKHKQLAWLQNCLLKMQ